jgi:CheY-like chemotaxis protein
MRCGSSNLDISVEVTTANNGQEALDAWKHDSFDCILMDQEMPVMDSIHARIQHICLLVLPHVGGDP